MRGSDVVARAVVVDTMGEAATYMDFAPSSGVGDGNFEFRKYAFTLTVNQGYDDNIYLTKLNKQGSAFTSGSLGFTYGTSTGTSSLQVTAAAGGSYYWDRNNDTTNSNGNFDPQINLSVGFSHSFSRKLRLDVVSYLAYQAQPDLQHATGQTGLAGNYFYGDIKLDLTQVWTRRFSTVYSYDIDGTYYDDSAFTNQDSYIGQTFGLQLRYLVRPTVTLTAEYRFGIVSYNSNSGRDSTSNYGLVGVDFNVNSRLTASLRVGAQFQNTNDFGSQATPFVENTFTYIVGKYTTASWTNRYGFEQSDGVVSNTQQTYRTGLTVNHKFSPRISGSLSGYYTYSTYPDGASGSQQTVDANAQMVFVINRVFSLQAGYTFTDVISDNAFNEYQRNRVYVGGMASF